MERLPPDCNPTTELGYYSIIVLDSINFLMFPLIYIVIFVIFSFVEFSYITKFVGASSGIRARFIFG
jgi:hypothetical protein